MKLISLLLAFTYGAGFFLILPLCFIYLNTTLSLPIIQNILFDAIGLFFLFAGITISLHSYSLFYTQGKGTPVPTDPPKQLIRVGLYKYSRNPIYIGHWSILIGASFLLGYPLLFVYLFLYIAGMHLWIVCVEEKELKKRLGIQYSEYSKGVPRYVKLGYFHP